MTAQGDPHDRKTALCPQGCLTFRETGFSGDTQKQYVFMLLSGIIKYTG